MLRHIFAHTVLLVAVGCSSLQGLTPPSGEVKAAYAAAVRGNCGTGNLPWYYFVEAGRLTRLVFRLNPACQATLLDAAGHRAWGIVDPHVVASVEENLISITDPDGLPPEFIDDQGVLYLGNDKEVYRQLFVRYCRLYVEQVEGAPAPHLYQNEEGRIGVFQYYKTPACEVQLGNAEMLHAWGVNSTQLGVYDATPGIGIAGSREGFPSEFFAGSVKAGMAMGK